MRWRGVVEQIHSNYSMSTVTLEMEGSEEGMPSVHTTREIMIEGTEETEERILLMYTTRVIVVERTRKTEETGSL